MAKITSNSKAAKKGLVKKRWVQIIAPDLFSNRVLGETTIYETQAGVGKDITVNLMTLTNNPKMQGINVSFYVNGHSEGKLTSIFTGYRIMPSVVRRLVRRGKDKIEDSYACTTLDGCKIRIKPLLVTRTKASGSAKRALTAEMKKHVLAKVSKTNFEQLAEDIISNRLQKGVNDSLSKIFPIIKCEIRWLKLLTKADSNPQKLQPEKVQEEKKVEVNAEASN